MAPATTPSKETTVNRPASPAQLDLIKRLQTERNIEHATDAQYAALTGGRDGTASKVITALLATPRPRRADADSFRNPEDSPGRLRAAAAGNVRQPLPEVPAGRYAIQLDTDEQLRFYKVDRPDEGRWAGYTFVKMFASDETYPVRGERAREVLTAIEADPQAAMLKYGQEIGACGHCGRKLTDKESRARGIGPVCASRMEW